MEYNDVCHVGLNKKTYIQRILQTKIMISFVFKHIFFKLFLCFIKGKYQWKNLDFIFKVEF